MHPELDVPLTPAVFFTLFALAAGPKHGYAIMQETRTLSDGSFRMGPATLYTTVQRLLEAELIAEVTTPANTDSRRRTYRLTTQGARFSTPSSTASRRWCERQPRCGGDRSR